MLKEFLEEDKLNELLRCFDKASEQTNISKALAYIAVWESERIVKFTKENPDKEWESCFDFIFTKFLTLYGNKYYPKFFNNLTPAELERLSLFIEESGECLQVIGKILRHGYIALDENTNKEYNNSELLANEIGQLKHTISLLTCNKDISIDTVNQSFNDRPASVKKYLHHQ